MREWGVRGSEEERQRGRNSKEEETTTACTVNNDIRAVCYVVH